MGSLYRKDDLSMPEYRMGSLYRKDDLSMPECTMGSLYRKDDLSMPECTWDHYIGRMICQCQSPTCIGSGLLKGEECIIKCHFVLLIVLTQADIGSHRQ